MKFSRCTHLFTFAHFQETAGATANEKEEENSGEETSKAEALYHPSS